MKWYSTFRMDSSCFKRDKYYSQYIFHEFERISRELTDRFAKHLTRGLLVVASVFREERFDTRDELFGIKANVFTLEQLSDFVPASRIGNDWVFHTRYGSVRIYNCVTKEEAFIHALQQHEQRSGNDKDFKDYDSTFTNTTFDTMAGDAIPRTLHITPPIPPNSLR